MTDNKQRARDLLREWFALGQNVGEWKARKGIRAAFTAALDEAEARGRAEAMRQTAYAECPLSERVDGPLHSWRFDGDAPHVICVYCDEMQDAGTGRVIRAGRTS